MLWLSSVQLANGQSSIFEKQLFISDGDTLPIRILHPLSSSAKKKYPLIVMLHGAGERGRDNEKQLFWGSGLFADSLNRARFPAIVLFPQCPEGNSWVPWTIRKESPNDSLGRFQISADSPATRPLEMVIAYIDKLVSEGKVDPDRIYVGGLSMGGMGTFDILARRPDLFAAAFPICGAGDPAVIAQYRKNLPIWVFHGSDDPVVKVANSRLMVRVLKESNPNVRYTEYPGVQHDSWKNAFAEPELIPWLMSKKKK